MEFITPIIVLSSISLFLGIMLVLADKFFADYGECRLIIAGEKELTVRGGETILSYLNVNNFNIPSSCGGKATCGYCKIKVLNGAGPILPTERPFLTRDEKDAGIRLACQLKVKNDIEIFMPDFLETVKNIVKNRLYDPKLRWRFNISNQMYSKHDDRKIKKKDDTDDKAKIYGIIENYKSMAGALVPVLQNINSAFNYLPEHGLGYISDELNIPLSQVYRVATFYNAFSFKPKGKNIIKVCLGTSCYVKGGKKIMETLEKELSIKVGESTEDLKYSLETVNCIGCCGQSPVITINEDIYGYLKHTMINDILKRY